MDRKPFAKVLATRISEVWAAQNSRKETEESSSGKKSAKTDKSLMVHICGPWGSGKTSVLNFVRDFLESDKVKKEWIVIDFNAWENQRIQPPWWPMIREIYRQGTAKLHKTDKSPKTLFCRALTRGEGGTGQADLKALDTLLGVVGGIVLLCVTLVARGRSILLGSPKAVKTFMETRRDPMKPIIKLFKKPVTATGRPVAIFIDDLDRCSADYVVDLLEGIQTLFRRANATYVVAADRNWIRTSFEKRYEDFLETIGKPGRPLGHLFLENLFQMILDCGRDARAPREAA